MTAGAKGKSYQPSPTKGGYDMMQVASAMQKMIRRGRELEAFYWAHELYDSGYTPYCLYRLAIINSEDIGFADPATYGAVNSTLALWMQLYKDRKNTTCEIQLPIASVILMMCRSRKSRIADDFFNLVKYRKMAGWRLEIPDIAIDQHNQAGRKLGRENAFWVDVGSVVEPEASIEELGGTSYKNITNPMWIEMAKDQQYSYRLSNPDDACSKIIREARNLVMAETPLLLGENTETEIVEESEENYGPIDGELIYEP